MNHVVLRKFWFKNDEVEELLRAELARRGHEDPKTRDYSIKWDDGGVHIWFVDEKHNDE